MSNRAVVALGFWPLPFVAETPLYLLALAGLVLGFVAGEGHALCGRLRLKRELRRRTREIEALRRELAAKEARPAEAAPAARDVVPLRG